MNQYWYSERTIAALVKEVATCEKIAFLSTPSVFFTLPPAQQKKSVVFDIDEQWAKKTKNFRRFDFNDPMEEDHSFDCAVVDPPFITKDVWTKYASAVRALLRPGGKVLLTTVGENEAMLRSIFGPDLRKARFMPAMHRPSLPYQYSLFLNYEPRQDSLLNDWNPEVSESDFAAANARRMVDEEEVVTETRALTGTSLTFEELLQRELQKTPPIA